MCTAVCFSKHSERSFIYFHRHLNIYSQYLFRSSIHFLLNYFDFMVLLKFDFSNYANKIILFVCQLARVPSIVEVTFQYTLKRIKATEAYTANYTSREDLLYDVFSLAGLRFDSSNKVSTSKQNEPNLGYSIQCYSTGILSVRFCFVLNFKLYFEHLVFSFHSF